MLYNFSEFLTQIKEDIGIKDVPLPVDDVALTKRFITSALREFSVRYPRIEELIITQDMAIDLTSRAAYGAVTYIIPEKYYRGSQILTVLSINSTGYGGSENFYNPTLFLGSSDMILESIADIKMASSLASMVGHAPTFRFDPPNRLVIYNGWTGSAFRVEVGMLHDPSLSTIPPGAMTHLRQLATLDICEYLYGKMKRIQNLETGVGSISLQIDNWENAGQEKRELLKEWDEDASLSLDSINYW